MYNIVSAGEELLHRLTKMRAGLVMGLRVKLISTFIDFGLQMDNFEKSTFKWS